MNLLRSFAVLSISALAAANVISASLEIPRLPAAPVIDGTATEWTDITPLSLTNSSGKAKLRLGQDARAFYAFIEVADSSPLRNSAARPQEMLKGGDALAFYFNSPDTGPQRVLFGLWEKQTLVYAHRPQSKDKQPYSFTSPVGETKFDFVAPLSGAQVVLTPTSYGYTAEVALPWTSLGFTRPPARFGFDFQVIFSDPAGSTNTGFLWLNATTGPGLTVEDLPTEAALYPDTWGEAALVDQLTASSTPAVASSLPSAPISGPATAGATIALNLPRDGRLTVAITDERGWIVRELIRAESVKAGPHTFTWDGRDRYGDVLPPGNYRWKALLFDRVGSRFYGSVGNSARPPFRTEDGKGSLGGQHGNQGTVAADAGGVYLGGALQEGEPAFRKVDTATGVALWKRSPGNFQSVLAVAADEGFLALVTTKGKKPDLKSTLVLVNPDTGETAKLAGKNEIELEAPAQWGEIADAAIAGARLVFSVPGEKRLGVINLKTGEKLPDIMLEAWGLARVNETTLLACTKDAVVRLDLATSKVTPLITGLVQPRDVAIEPTTGNLFVTDLGTSQQVKKFTPAGKSLAAFGRPGGKPAEMPVAYDPLAFSNVTGLIFATDGTLWMKESSATPKRFIHLAADGKWLEDFCGPVAYNVFGPDLDDVSRVYYNPNEASARWIETKVDYSGYEADPAKAGNWSITAIHDLSLGADGVTANPVMEAVAKEGYGHAIVFTGTNGKRYFFRLSKFNRASSPGGAGLWIWKNDRWAPSVFISSDEKKFGRSWRDANGDGLISDDEYFTSPVPDRYSWIDRDLTLHGFTGLLAPASLDKNGLPVYDQGTFTAHLPGGSPYVSSGDLFASAKVNGSVYYAVNSGPHRHLAFWDRATDNRIVKVTNGKVDWVTGIHNAKGGFAEFSTISGIAGVVDDMLIAHNVEGSRYVAYTTDGMALGEVAATPDGRVPSVGGTAVYIESFTGLFIKDPGSNRRLLFYVVSGDDRIVEVTGPGKTDRYEGVLALKTSAGDDAVVIPYSSLYGNVSRGLGIDGQDTEWEPTVPRLTVSGPAGAVADIRLRRDAGSLVVIADILDSTPLQSGEGFELALGRTAARPDVLLTFTAPPAAPATGKDRKWRGTATLTRNGQPADATGILVAPSLRWENLGYSLEAEIPLSLLPEFATDAPQTFKRDMLDPRTGKLGKLGNVTETRPDLKAPLFLNVRVLRQENGKPAPASLSATGLLPVTLAAAPVKK